MTAGLKLTTKGCQTRPMASCPTTGCRTGRAMTTTVHQAARANYHIAEDYYLDGAVSSEWFGALADHWGLVGPVGKRESALLEKGLSPDGKTRVVQNAEQEGRFGGTERANSPPGEFRLVWGLEPDP